VVQYSITRLGKDVVRKHVNSTDDGVRLLSIIWEEGLVSDDECDIKVKGGRFLASEMAKGRLLKSEGGT